MYLVHTALQPGAAGGPLPPDARELLLAAARVEDRIEHVVLHPHAVPHPVLGVYLLADSMEEAEARVAGFCDRALAAVRPFTGWCAAPPTVPLVVPFYERLLAEYGRPGRNGPGRLPPA
ncbi:hypothetical protein [Kitasatospora sp. NPDC088351]|uniref:hypothetical protein n=1 Tax=unclassified Kitasatospora TaxID=2633591 RepID=UPI003435FAB6